MAFQQQYVNLGCDPEFWFMKDGKVIGSEKVLNIKTGLDVGRGKIVVDGVQAELNPHQNSCRQSLSYNISQSFVQLAAHIKAMGEAGNGITVSIAPIVKISKQELISLSESCQTFGCQPSLNINAKFQNKVKNKNPTKYLYRSAGGHIHLGLTAMGSTSHSRFKEDPTKLVRILDIILGNTCVLLDRDEGNIERRKVYGMAGEYRLPAHGLEYRTLSNFWLRDYKVMSLVFALARVAVGIVYSEYKEGEVNLYDQFVNAVDYTRIVRAIQLNDYNLAMDNWNAVKEVFRNYRPEGSNPILYSGLQPFYKNVDAFTWFAEQGLDKFFKKDEDPIYTWRYSNCGSNAHGWESFFDRIVNKYVVAVRAIAAKEAKAQQATLVAPAASTEVAVLMQEAA